MNYPHSFFYHLFSDIYLSYFCYLYGSRAREKGLIAKLYLGLQHISLFALSYKNENIFHSFEQFRFFKKIQLNLLKACIWRERINDMKNRERGFEIQMIGIIKTVKRVVILSNFRKMWKAKITHQLHLFHMRLSL